MLCIIVIVKLKLVSHPDAMKLFQIQPTQRLYNLAALGFFALMVGIMVVNTVVARHVDVPLVGSSSSHVRFYGIVLALSGAAVMFVGYLSGNRLALTFSTLLAALTVGLGLHANAFAYAVPQAIWVPTILALTVTSLRWSLVVFTITVLFILFRFPHAFQVPHGLEITTVILVLLVFNRLVHDLLVKNAQKAEEESRRMAEQVEGQNRRLKAGQDALDTILAAVPDILAEMDEDGTYLMVRSRNQCYLGMRAEALLGKTVGEVLPPDAAALILQALAEAKLKGSSYGRIVEILRPHGSTWLELSVARKDGEGGAGNRFIVISRDITDRYRAEAEARRLSQVIEQSPASIVMTDRQGRIVYVNPAFTHVSGYSQQDAIGQWPKFLGAGKTPASATEEMWRVLGAGQIWRGEFLNRRKDGSEYIEEATISPLRDAAGAVTHYVGIKRDITAIRRQEETIVRDQRRLKNVLSGTGAGPWEWDVSAGKLLLDETSARMIGLSLEEMGDDHLKAWLKRVHPDDLPAVRERIQQHIQQGTERFESDYRIRHADGRWLWIQTRGKVIDWRRDNIPLTMYGVHLDITAQRQAEESRQYLEGLLHSAIEVIGEGFAVYDSDDRLAWCNEEYRRLYPLSEPAFIPGTPFEEILRFGIARGQYAEAHDNPEAWLAKRLEAHRRTESSSIQQLSDGRWIHVRERKTADGSLVGFRIDVTELMEAKQAAEAANRAKSEFLATMSHEIRTPMNSILGMAQVLCSQEVTDPRSREYGRIILDSGRNLLALLNDVLDLAKVEAGRVELERKPWQPEQLIEDILALFKGAAQTKGLAIETKWKGPERRRYLADGHRLQQMLANLVSNAIKFTPSGFVSIEIREVEEQLGVATLEFAVADSGIGIPRSKQASLFYPFNQADSSISRSFGGSGLGLSIVRNLAILMGGSVGLESEEGKGSRLWFRIAASLAPDAPERTGRAQGPAPALNGSFIGQVLVVEDNALERKVIGTLLTRLGLSVAFASDGLPAVEAACDVNRPDLILMDCYLPTLDGNLATARIRAVEAERQLKRVPIVGISASVFEQNQEHCIESGMDDFLPKPIAMAQLGAILDKFLPRRAIADASAAAQPPVAARLFDRAALSKAVEALTPLLEKGKFDALQAFSELERLTADSDIGPEIEDIGKSVKAFEFESVLTRLNRLIQFPTDRNT